MSNDENAKPLEIIDQNNKNIFEKEKYIIPIYQRAYEWGKEQVLQLIEDINSIENSPHYYMGTLIVCKKDSKFEIIDGQQRLTTLFILLNCLGKHTEPTLTFECREKSNYTLEHIEDIISGKICNLESDNILEKNIVENIRFIKQQIEESFEKDKFIKKLEKVILYRVQVPEKTDLNRYFEIMNTRGEQLEQQDIVKAYLMNSLKAKERAVFATIWDACSDMDGYLQMNFESRNNNRALIFGEKWDEMPKNDWEYYEKLNLSFIESEEENQTINEIVKLDSKGIENLDVVEDGDTYIRFKSIIEFPYFLLHVLQVFIKQKSIENKDINLDDKRLIDNFKTVIPKDNVQLSKEFLICLIRCRFLFDKYIIKREFKNDDKNGIWSLKELKQTNNDKKTAYYRNTRFEEVKDDKDNIDKDDDVNNDIVKKNLMIQSALRVTYISPKSMNWITELMSWLIENNCEHINYEGIKHYEEQAEKFAIDKVKSDFFYQCPNENYNMGLNTPHIVFNYLDFLLWKNNKDKYKDFVFEFRNSIEHWYPQEQTNTPDTWTHEEGLDSFGNLCLIHSENNSRFSNLPPSAKLNKKDDNKENCIDRESLKLRKMAEKAEFKDDKSYDKYWKEKGYKEHEDEMIDILKNACHNECEKS